MIEKIFEFIDGVIRHFNSFYEKGILQFIIFISVVLLIATGVILFILYIDEKKNDIPSEKQMVIDQALAFCKEKNFNAWKWNVEDNFTFNCYNESTAKDNLTNYYLP